MPEKIAYLMLLFFFLSIGLFIGLASFAFSEPSAFARWIPPMKIFFRKASEKACLIYSYSIGILMLFLCLVLSFAFGSLSTSFAMNFWSSPLLKILEKWAN